MARKKDNEPMLFEEHRTIEECINHWEDYLDACCVLGIDTSDDYAKDTLLFLQEYERSLRNAKN